MVYFFLHQHKDKDDTGIFIQYSLIAHKIFVGLKKTTPDAQRLASGWRGDGRASRTAHHNAQTNLS
jgi:hypothetical protein